MPTPIAYYISGHGYGHAARQQPVLRRLAAAGNPVYVRTRAPRKFADAPGIHYHEASYDVGMIQSDPLHMDLPATIAACHELMAREAAIIAKEVAMIRETGVRLVASDMPSLALAIADAADIPGVAVTQFTWDWVYAFYRDAYPEFDPIIAHIREQYGRATLALQLPFYHEFDMFPAVEQVPLLINPTTRSRDAIRAEMRVPEEHKLGVLSLGGLGWTEADLAPLRELEGWTFLLMPGAYEQLRDWPHARYVPMGYENYHDLIAAADVLVGKTGWSTVAEVIAHQTPMLYTSRDDWRESQLLERALRDYGQARRLSRAEFTSGAWVRYVDDLVQRPLDWPFIATNGAQVVAERLLELARG